MHLHEQCLSLFKLLLLFLLLTLIKNVTHTHSLSRERGRKRAKSSCTAINFPFLTRVIHTYIILQSGRDKALLVNKKKRNSASCVCRTCCHMLFPFPLFLSLSILLKTFVCMPCHSMPTRGSRLSPKKNKKNKKKTQNGYSSSSPIPNSSRRTIICKPSTSTTTTTPHTQR